MKLVSKLKVKNQMGLHTRPCTYIVKLLQKCSSDVQFTYRKNTVNAKSILGLLMLAAQENAKITVTVEGADAEVTMKKIEHAFDTEFGEP